MSLNIEIKDIFCPYCYTNRPVIGSLEQGEILPLKCPACKKVFGIRVDIDFVYWNLPTTTKGKKETLK